MKTISILGASGFVGQQLVFTLLHYSNVNLHLLLRDPNRLKINGNQRVNIHIGDMTRCDDLDDFIQPGCTVINLAYLSSNDNVENLSAIQNLITVCIQKKIKRLIHCSTAAVAGRTKDTVVTEQSTCIPLNEYEKTKLAIEKALIESYEHQFEVVIIRPTAIYGPGVKNLVKLARELTHGNTFLRYLRSSLFNSRRMNLVSIDNVAHSVMYLSLHRQNIDGEVFIISDDDQPNNNYRDVEILLCKYLSIDDYRLPIIPLPKFILKIMLAILKRSNINPLRIYSSEKLKKLGFCGDVAIQDGIASFANWYKNELLQKKSSAL